MSGVGCIITKEKKEEIKWITLKGGYTNTTNGRAVWKKKNECFSARDILWGRIKHYEKKLVAFPLSLSLTFPLRSGFSYLEKKL